MGRVKLHVALIGAIALAAACSAEPPLSPVDSGSDAQAEPDAGSSSDAAPMPVGPVVGPTQISQTGLYSDFTKRTISPDVIPYVLRSEPWSDGEAITRYFYLPPDTQIDTANMDYWIYPVGTKAWQEFRIGGKLVETRYLWKARRDAWWMSAYVWAADGSDAVSTPSGIKNPGTQHDVASHQDCERCHTNVPDVVIAFSALQLSNGGDGLLTKLGAQNRLTAPPSGEFEMPGDGNTKDALWYLQTNCAYCHNIVSKLTKQSALHTCIETDETEPDETCVYETGPFLRMRHITPPGVWDTLVPGNPNASGLYLRMLHRGDGWEMPPIGTKVVDQAGCAIVSEWIRTLSCGAACTTN